VLGCVHVLGKFEEKGSKNGGLVYRNFIAASWQVGPWQFCANASAFNLP
jgi:hypothetical protein